MTRKIKHVIAKFNSVNIFPRAKFQSYVSLLASIALPGYWSDFYDSRLTKQISLTNM